MADGPGFRTAIYCAGCRHACKGCHNPESWDFNAGRWMDVEELLADIKADELSDVSFSGGDPFYQVEAFTELARRIKEETTKTIWCWTGFTLEEIQADEKLSQLLPYLGAARHGPAVPRQPQPTHHLPPRRPAGGHHPRYRGLGATAVGYSGGE